MMWKVLHACLFCLTDYMCTFVSIQAFNNHFDCFTPFAIRHTFEKEGEIKRMFQQFFQLLGIKLYPPAVNHVVESSEPLE